MGNGVNESFNYDARWRLLSASATKTPNTLYSLGGPGTGNTMTYAPNSQLTAANDSVNGNWSYSYDALNRIAGANQSGGTNFSFDIDSNANRWHQNPVGQGAQLSFDNSTNHITYLGVIYDAAGNIINDGLHTYTYDAGYRITQVDSGATATYFYDAFGRRARRTVNGTGLEDVYDGANMIAEFSASTGGWWRGEVYALGSHLATYAMSNTFFAHKDWLGSERVRSDANGNSAGTCTSNAYGDNYVCAGTDPSPIKYAGMEYDSESQLYHTLFRYYNPRLGSWMTPDPAGLGAASPGDSRSLNRYAYALNDPINGVDPLGLDVIPCNSAAAAKYGCTSLPGRDAGVYLDYGYIPGDLVGLLIPDGSAVECPGGDCSIFSQTFSSPNGLTSYTPVLGVNGIVWVNNRNGGELSDTDVAELGLTLDGHLPAQLPLGTPQFTLVGAGGQVPGPRRSTSNYAAGTCVTTVPQLRKFGGCSYTCTMIREDPTVDPSNFFLAFPVFKGPTIDQACGPGTFCPVALVIEEQVPPPGPVLFVAKPRILSCTM